MESYFFINRNGEFRIAEADPLLQELLNYIAVGYKEKQSVGIK